MSPRFPRARGPESYYHLPMLAGIRPTPLAVSVLLHVIVYATLMVVPVPASVERIGLVAELVPSEPLANEPPPAVTPPRPRPPAPAPRIKRAPTPWPIETPTPSPARPSSVEAAPVTSPTPAPATPSAAPAAEVSSVAPDDVPAQVVADAAPARSDSASIAATRSASGDAAEAPSSRAPAATASVAALRPAGLTRTAIPRGGYQVTPSYPPSARRLGIEGTTVLSVLVEADGRVADVVVKQSAGHPDLDRAAAEAVRRWRFEPARRGAETVAMWVELPVEFHLR